MHHYDVWLHYLDRATVPLLVAENLTALLKKAPLHQYEFGSEHDEHAGQPANPLCALLSLYILHDLDNELWAKPRRPFRLLSIPRRHITMTRHEPFSTFNERSVGKAGFFFFHIIELISVGGLRSDDFF